VNEHELNNLRAAWLNASCFFWCNTNREKGPGSNILETRMHQKKFAAIWTDGDTGRVRFVSHMRQVRRNDLIFMFAKD
jgi:hypothetical protein